MKKIVLGLLVISMCAIGPDAFALTGIDAYTVLMLHFNGNFTDSSFSNHTVTAVNEAHIDTAEKKFGSGSAYFDGYGDYLSIPDSEDWSFGSGNFTMDFWVNFEDSVKNKDFAVQVESNSAYWIFTKEGNVLRFKAKKDDEFVAWYYTPSWTPSPQSWHHITLARDGSDMYMFIDGVSQSLTVDTPIYNNSLAEVEAPLRIGTGWDGDMQGWFDEFRISKGIARWTSDFTPPTEEYGIIPEPTTLSLLGLGLLGLVFRKKNA